jgi:RNA polymerase sigma factor (sigma-70 family)
VDAAAEVIVNRQPKQLTDLQTASTTSDSPSRELVRFAIAEHWQSLQGLVQMFIIQLGVSSDRRIVESLSEDILNDVVETALKIADRYDPTYPARPWLRKIAFNKVRDYRRKVYRDRAKVIAIADVSNVRRFQSQSIEQLSEDEMFGLVACCIDTPSSDSPALDELLSLVSESDRQILKLAFVDGLRGRDLAANLGIREGAASTRLSRAIDRLRKAYLQSASTIRRSQDV